MKPLLPLRSLLVVLGLCLSLPATASSGNDVALVTALEGKVERIVGKVRQPVQSFVKLKQGDFLALEGDARIQIVFFASRRQEAWQGGGRLEVAAVGGNGLGLAEPQVKVLPEVLVRQIAKTPALDSQGRAGVVRLRAIATTEVLAKLDNDYKRLRMEADRDDLNPEIFLLAGLLETRQLDRLEGVLNDLQLSHPSNPEAGLLVALYKKALKNMRESGK